MNFYDMQKLLDEAIETLDRFEKLDMMKFSLEDQAQIMGAVTAYADVLKPIVDKYDQQLPKPQIFFTRLDEFLDD